jgi:hypothetical protein
MRWTGYVAPRGGKRYSLLEVLRRPKSRRKYTMKNNLKEIDADYVVDEIES